MKLKFTEDAAAHLWETPFNGSQELEILPGGYCMLTAEADDTKELRWWILGFGAGVEVVSPSLLRSEIVHEVERVGKLYGG